MTPIRHQYLRIKQGYPEAIVLFRLGDFYETFDEDARLASRELDIVLTSRSMGKGLKVPMAGIPAHSLDPYLARLIKKGHTVAICEQLSDPNASKGLVERDVVRLVTPGTVLEPSLLDQGANNYLAAVVADGVEAGLAYVDISTGEFAVTQLPEAEVPLELGRLSPAEVLVPQEGDWSEKNAVSQDSGSGNCVITPISSSAFGYDNARQTILDHFGTLTLEPFGCAGLPLAIRAAGAVVEYLGRTRRGSLDELANLNTYSTSGFMTLDAQSRRNLELFQGGRWASDGPSLLSTLDLTRTPMGGRLLRRWLGQPLLDLGGLTRRQDAVEFFHGALVTRERALFQLSRIGDMERALNRVRLGTAAPQGSGGPEGRPGGGRRAAESFPARRCRGHLLAVEVDTALRRGGGPDRCRVGAGARRGAGRWQRGQGWLLAGAG